MIDNKEDLDKWLLEMQIITYCDLKEVDSKLWIYCKEFVSPFISDSCFACKKFKERLESLNESF